MKILKLINVMKDNEEIDNEYDNDNKWISNNND